MASNATTEFSGTLRRLRSKSGKTRYKLAQYSGLNEAYVFRLESGERRNPSRDIVVKLCLALVADSDAVSIHDVNELILSGGFAPLRGRGESGPAL